MSELDEIRARLAAATPGQWAVDDSVPSLGYDINDVPCGVRKAFDRREDADFIAHAPADIARLLDLVDALTRERDGLRLALRATSEQGDTLARENEAMSALLLGANEDMLKLEGRAARWKKAAKAQRFLVHLNYDAATGYKLQHDALARDLDICRADRSALAAARAWVRQHGQHPPSCGAVKGERCDCGLDELR